MKRSRFEIMVDILSCAKEGTNKTRIVYGAMINFRMAGEYLNFLIEAELLSTHLDNNRTVFKTTDKGMETLEKFKALFEMNTNRELGGGEEN